MSTDDSVKEDVDVPVGPMKGEDVDANLKIDSECKEMIGINYTSNFILFLLRSLSNKTRFTY